MGGAKAFTLPGNLAPVEARGLAVVGQIKDFLPVRLARASHKIESVVTED